MIAEVENTMTLTGSRALVIEQATQNESRPVRAEVLRFGKASAFTETRVSFGSTGKLVAHASLEFAF
jgi:acyl-coenzyme A thioesterase PaaI-like protein